MGARKCVGFGAFPGPAECWDSHKIMGKTSYSSYAAEIGLTISLAAVLYLLAVTDAGGFFSGLILSGVGAVDPALERLPERRLPLFMWPLAEVGLASLVALVTLLATRRMSWFTLPFAAVLTGALIYGAAILAWKHGQILIDPLTTLVILGAIMAGCTVYRIFERQAHSRTLRAVLGTGVSRQMLQVLTNAGRPLEKDGVERTITTLFCDLRDVDALFKSYEKSPEALVQILRMSLEPLMNEIRINGGTVERTSTTGLKAMWNAPVQIADHEKRACDTAMALLDKLDDINRALEHLAADNDLPYTPLSLGIGINTGQASIGNIGTDQEPLYSALGSSVRFARYLQDASESYGPAVIIGETTLTGVDRDFAFMQVDKIALGESDRPQKAFALLGNPLTKASPKFRDIVSRHETLISAYEGANWEQARQALRACRDLETIHPQLYDLYESRIDYLRRNPPGQAWDGVFRQKTR